MCGENKPCKKALPLFSFGKPPCTREHRRQHVSIPPLVKRIDYFPGTLYLPLLSVLLVGVRVDPGDHVFLSYGPVSNDDLLQYYGFVERDNPSDAYVLQDMGKWLREVSKL